MLLERSRLIGAIAVVALVAGAAGCRPEQKYEPRPAPSGEKANLPPVPNLPTKPIKKGDAYTIWGASLELRSQVHHDKINGQEITLEGYIAKTNLPDAPACAVHKEGKADPEGCKAPVPMFWVCDNKTDKIEECIQVMGWASNFANIWKAIEQYEKDEKTAKNRKDDKKPEAVTDEFWGVELPRPLPAVGGKVKVKGTYKTTFTQASGGTAADPIMGILSYKSMEWLEPAPEVASLPGMDKKKKGGG